jgi:hypothetical protein
MARVHGWTARQVDELELWEVAVYLGMDEPREVPEDPYDPRYGGDQLGARMAKAAEVAAARRAERLASGADEG